MAAKELRDIGNPAQPLPEMLSTMHTEKRKQILRGKRVDLLAPHGNGLKACGDAVDVEWSWEVAKGAFRMKLHDTAPVVAAKQVLTWDAVLGRRMRGCRLKSGLVSQISNEHTCPRDIALRN